jgi:hypothetical protein
MWKPPGAQHRILAGSDSFVETTGKGLLTVGLFARRIETSQDPDCRLIVPMPPSISSVSVTGDVPYALLV